MEGGGEVGPQREAGNSQAEDLGAISVGDRIDRIRANSFLILKESFLNLVVLLGVAGSSLVLFLVLRER